MASDEFGSNYNISNVENPNSTQIKIIVSTNTVLLQASASDRDFLNYLGNVSSDVQNQKLKAKIIDVYDKLWIDNKCSLYFYTIELDDTIRPYYKKASTDVNVMLSYDLIYIDNKFSRSYGKTYIDSLISSYCDKHTLIIELAYTSLKFKLMTSLVNITMKCTLMRSLVYITIKDT